MFQPFTNIKLIETNAIFYFYVLNRIQEEYHNPQILKIDCYKYTHKNVCIIDNLNNETKLFRRSIWKMKTATKMYLSVVLSTLCIMFYQYQLSKANFITSQRNVGGSNTISGENGIANGNIPLVWRKFTLL